MKNLVFLYFLAFFCFFSFTNPPSVQAENISTAHVDLRLAQDGTFFVSESLLYNFENQERHGIFRTIPLSYHIGTSTFKITLSNIRVTDEKNQTEPFSVTEKNNQLTIKIGDPDTLITGSHTYNISYEVVGLIDYYDDHDEIYWNAIGTEWTIPIEDIYVRFIPPPGIPLSKLPAKCYVGTFGTTKTKDCSYSIGANQENTVTDITFYQTHLNPQEGLTVAIGFPKGLVAITSKEPYKDALVIFTENKIFWITLYVLLFLIPLLFTVFFYGTQWWKFGRDARIPKPIIVQYDPPQGLLPAEVGLTVKGNLGEHVLPGKFIVGEIIYLAIKGYLKITREKAHWYIPVNYLLEKTKTDESGLVEYQKIIFQKLFTHGDKTSLKELRKENQNNMSTDAIINSFYTSMGAAMRALKEDIFEKGLFDQESNKKRNSGFWKGLLVVTGSLIVMWVGMASANLTFNLLGNLSGAHVKTLWFNAGIIFSVATFCSGVYIALFSPLLDRRTIAGAQAKADILGLKKYLTVAEKDRLNFHNAPEKNPQEFEKLLPYAIVLGVEKKWAKQFESLSMPPRDWYSGASALSAVSLTQDLGSSFAGAFGTATGTGGGASGGGGSAGGGGGGGGGGSW